MTSFKYEVGVTLFHQKICNYGQQIQNKQKKRSIRRVDSILDSLDGDFKVDVDLGVPGDAHDVGELDGEPRGLVEVVDGQDLHARGADHHLGLVHVRALKIYENRKLW